MLSTCCWSTGSALDFRCWSAAPARSLRAAPADLHGKSSYSVPSWVARGGRGSPGSSSSPTSTTARRESRTTGSHPERAAERPAPLSGMVGGLVPKTSHAAIATRSLGSAGDICRHPSFKRASRLCRSTASRVVSISDSAVSSLRCRFAADRSRRRRDRAARLCRTDLLSVRATSSSGSATYPRSMRGGKVPPSGTIFEIAGGSRCRRSSSPTGPSPLVPDGSSCGRPSQGRYIRSPLYSR